MKLKIENIRGFAGKHFLDVKPLTILIGENSSGKTTLLSTLFAALQNDFPSNDAFNRSPFEMGSFDTIATYRGGKYGRSTSFTIGIEAGGRLTADSSATFESHLGTPRLRRMSIKKGSQEIVGDLFSGEWSISDSGRTRAIKIDVPDKSAPSFGEYARALIEKTYTDREVQKKDSLHRVIMDLLFQYSFMSSDGRPNVTALAPLRSRPRRTYDELIDDFKPEGDHVPLVLARAFAGDINRGKELLETLEAFGRSSGLFSQLKVKRMGRNPSDPFQIRVKSTGPDANLVDVGYGVSQALPVIVDSIQAENGRIVLVQQPEVHLHPKAQAALGTLFAQLASGKQKTFVIETHSDFLVDRVRMAVAAGQIKKSDVNIAFLSRDGLNVNIHHLELDDLGNIENAPAAYRSFFLQEEIRLMSRGHDLINN